MRLGNARIDYYQKCAALIQAIEADGPSVSRHDVGAPPPPAATLYNFRIFCTYAAVHLGPPP